MSSLYETLREDCCLARNLLEDDYVQGVTSDGTAARSTVLAALIPAIGNERRAREALAREKGTP